jgi:two-component system, sensor histidine kinase LadS
MLTGAPASATLAQIAAGKAGHFVPFNPDISHDTSWETPLWLHFRISTDNATPANAWTVVLDKPFIDRVEFYALNAQGDWRMQAAGDWIAHDQWPQRSLSPQFYLPALNPGEHDFYVRVFNQVPLHFSIQLLDADVANLQMQQTFTITALMLAFIALMSLLSSALALMYRNTTYAWYAVYVAINGVAILSYLGIGSYGLWRQSTWWPGQSILLCVMATALVQLQFSRAMFVGRAASPRLYHGISAALLMGAVGIGLFVTVNHLAFKVWSFVTVFAGCVVLLLAIAARAVRQSGAVARLWLLAYTPLAMAIALAIVDSFGWYALTWLPYNLPLYALLFEMPVLLIALNLHAKTLHTQQVRKTTLANIDPATGYVAPHLFTATLETLWQQAQDQWQDMVVAYVLVQHDAQKEATGHTDSVQRTVRALRTVVREQDTIAHIKPQLFAILMPSMALNDALAQRLARLVAVGRMVDVNAPQAPLLLFRVVASSKAGFAGTWQQLDASLRRKLYDAHGWSRKSIRYVRLRAPNESQPESDLVSLSQLWDVAVEESARLDAVKP